MALPFRRKKEPDLEQTREQKLETYGLHVVSDEQLKERLDKIEELTKEVHRSLVGATPIDKMASLKDKIHSVDTLVHKTSIAWLRAGTEKDYRRAVNGYENLLHYVTRDWSVINNEMATKTTVEQGKMELEFELWPAGIYFKEALFLTSMSFFDKDVTPTLDRTMVVQTQPSFGMPFMGAGTTAPTSGGRTSEDQSTTANLPAQMPNTVQRLKPKPKQNGEKKK